MTDLLSFYSKHLAESGLRVFEKAFEESSQRQQNIISYGHILKALKSQEPELFDKTLANLKADAPLTDEFLDSFIEDGRRYSAVMSVPDLCCEAMEVARADSRRKIESTDLILAIERIVIGAAPWLRK